jgi:predicted nucleic acid-binding protein
MLENRVFLDTNVLIYAYDVSAGQKHEIAKNLLIDLWNSGLGLLSTQVLQEFFVNVVQKIPHPMSIEMASEIIRDFLKWDVVINNGDSILESIEICKRYGYSFWDSLIIEAALRGGAETLLSEDLSPGQTINGMTIRNPFHVSKE